MVRVGNQTFKNTQEYLDSKNKPQQKPATQANTATIEKPVGALDLPISALMQRAKDKEEHRHIYQPAS